MLPPSCLQCVLRLWHVFAALLLTKDIQKGDTQAGDMHTEGAEFSLITGTSVVRQDAAAVERCLAAVQAQAAALAARRAAAASRKHATTEQVPLLASVQFVSR